MVFIDWFLPGTNAGGPVRSVYSMVKILKADYDFKLFTRNTDHNSTKPYEGIKPDSWVNFDEGIEVYYCSEKNLTKQTIKATIESVNADSIYINSFYSPWFSIYPLQIIKKLKLQEKVVLAPRGMLGKGALAIKSFKKKLFIRLAKFKGLHIGITWQASSENEKKDIEAVFGRFVKIKVAGNLSYIEQLPFHKRNKQVGELRLFFLSRIVPIKNLHAALDALGKVDPSKNVVFDIYGPLEEEAYWQKCQVIIAQLPSNIVVSYKGVITNEKTQLTLQNYHALYMPTLNENFGHSILESFAAGCLVVISDQTPWNNLQTMNIGYNAKVYEKSAEEELLMAINALLNLNEHDFNTFGLKAWTFAHFYGANNQNLQLNKTLFNT